MHMAIHTSTSMNEDEPPFKRRRLTFIRRQMTILMLPNDLILNCLARISRLYYPTLSLVSKRFRSLLTSEELYQTRNLLGCTESCLYVSLQLHNDPKTLRWFTLFRRPYSSRNILVPISSPGSLSAPWSDVGMVGHNIYIIGGLMNNNESSSVMVFDCYSHTLRKAPSMHITRLFPSACVFDEKIYVTGGSYKGIDSTNWMEVFDTKTQTWEFLHIPCEDLRRGYKFESVGHEGTIYVMSKEKHVAYKLHRGKWRATDLAMKLGWNCSLSYCVIENVFYRCDDIGIDWYDPLKRSWKKLKGLEGKIPKFSSNVKMMDYGGRMAVLWKEDDVSTNKHKKRIIWFAEITIDKQQNGEIWGTVNGPDIVSTTTEPYSLVHALATTM